MSGLSPPISGNITRIDRSDDSVTCTRSDRPNAQCLYRSYDGLCWPAPGICTLQVPKDHKDERRDSDRHEQRRRRVPNCKIRYHRQQSTFQKLVSIQRGFINVS